MGIYLPLLFLVIGLCLSIFVYFSGGIFFHTDIARDFLLMEDIVKNHHIALIGPHTGGISGVFHGPAWLYLNLPAFVLGHGNPWIIGTFWLLLVLLSILILWYIGKLLFDQTTGLWSAGLYALYAIVYARNLLNPFGAVLLSAPFFYFVYLYTKTSQKVYLALAFFLLGMLIQFQIAFGAPILILTFFLVIRHVLRTKKFAHLLLFLFLLIPLSTYIVFELRHDFLQMRSVSTYLQTSHREQGVLWYVFPLVRIKTILESIQIFPYWWANILLVFLGYVVLKKKKITRKREVFKLFLYYFAGYWVLTVPYFGTIWQYYYWPFLPIIIILFVEILRYLSLKQRAVLYGFVGIVILSQQLRLVFQTHMRTDASSWIFQEKIAQQIFDDAPKQFGYYVFTPDLFGYSPRYAMNYVAQTYTNKKAYAFEKKHITYLLIAPPPDDRLFLDGVWWKKHQVNIQGKPQRIFKYANRFRVEKYALLNNEQQVASDPNLIQSLIFR